LREIFARDIYINREIRKRYDNLLSGFIFKGRDMKNIFMLCLALGYLKGRRKPVTNIEVKITASSFSDQDLWTIAAIAVESNNNLQVINNGPEMKKIATEYAHAGLDDLETLVTEYGSGENLEMAIQKLTIDVLKTNQNVK
jgi:hypothetical protein